MKRRAFMGLLGVSAAALIIPKRTIFLPPWSRYDVIQTLPFREPDPALFEMLEDLAKAADDLCDVSECWYRPDTAGSWRRTVYARSRTHEADRPGTLLRYDVYPRLELPFV